MLSLVKSIMKRTSIREFSDKRTRVITGTLTAALEESEVIGSVGNRVTKERTSLVKVSGLRRTSIINSFILSFHVVTNTIKMSIASRRRELVEVEVAEKTPSVLSNNKGHIWFLAMRKEGERTQMTIIGNDNKIVHIKKVKIGTTFTKKGIRPFKMRGNNVNKTNLKRQIKKSMRFSIIRRKKRNT